ncbi:MAG: DUF2877 domain-containing protein [Candidatus Erginobacter occultus]|nr:DUF2877 domain-containing protein [Candidatus Erginobacter occultus]
MRIISVGDRVRRGNYRVHSRFSRAVNYLRGEQLVSLVSEEAGRGPVNIVVGEGGLEAAGEELEVDEGGLRLDGSFYSLAGVEAYDSRWLPGTVDREGLRTNLAVLEDFLKENAPPESLVFLLEPGRGKVGDTSFRGRLEARFRSAAADIFRSEAALVAGCRRFKGLGSGLTPAGDDFVAGVLAGFGVLERMDGVDRTGLKGEIAAGARGENPLVNSFISLTVGGWFFERLNNCLDGLAGDDPAEVRWGAGELIAFGASSGSDLAVGLLLTLKNCRGGVFPV